MANQSPPPFAEFQPGDFVRLPTEPDLGVGQVQSVVGDKATVNFDHAGKVTLMLSKAPLESVDTP